MSVGGGGARWTRRYSTMRSPPKDTVTQLAMSACFGKQTRYPPRDFGINESDGAPGEKESRPKHEPPGYQACMMRG